ncbi:hypothetical protein [Paenibacillus ehimensis]|uniref:Uncharacterized protein n=1 Tax=Paenibacillus ehimensis TaxID=79264 RepID=A0ABT8VI20_9BACL|nr:hypothetical protein [Paenibacillus ehimensis]MDO3680596.1 hypothetical protein [Paenibacillus ehimensis]
MKQANAAGGPIGGIRADKLYAEAQAWRAAAPYSAYLYIWGMAWMASAILTFVGQWRDWELLQPVLFLLALVLTAAVLLRRRRTASERPAQDGVQSALLVAAAVVAVVWLLTRGLVGIDPFYWPVLKGLALTAAYTALFPRLGWVLGAFGLWMLALTVTVVWMYLGYAPVLIGGFGGLSMVALGAMIRMRDKGMNAQ